jgi:hypothetical protein
MIVRNTLYGLAGGWLAFVWLGKKPSSLLSAGNVNLGACILAFIVIVYHYSLFDLGYFKLLPTSSWPWTILSTRSGAVQLFRGSTGIIRFVMAGYNEFQQHAPSPYFYPIYPDTDNKVNDHDDEPIVVTRNKACTYAARYGRLVTLRWLRDESVHDNKPLPWNSSTLLAAAAAYADGASSSRYCLDYAIDHGCPWTCAFQRWEHDEEEEEGQDPLFSNVVKLVDRMARERRYARTVRVVVACEPVVWPVPVAGRWEDAARRQQRRLLDEPGDAALPRRISPPPPPRGDHRRQQRHVPPPQKRGGGQRRRRRSLQQPQPSKGRRRS